MCSENRAEKPLDTHDHMVCRSWAIFSMVSPIFSGVLVVISGDVICGNILNIFWVGIQTTKTAV